MVNFDDYNYVNTVMETGTPIIVQLVYPTLTAIDSVNH